MMAEASSKGTVDASGLSGNDLLTKTNSGDHDADGSPLLNGSPAEEFENKHITDIVDELVNSTEVSVSGGSDTEASRGDSTKKDGDLKGHSRTVSAVKKPTSFKSVSVNKTFLAAKGAVATAGKLGDKTIGAASSSLSQPGSSTLTAGRPRLIAKSGSSLRDVPRSGAGGNGAPGPDPAAVWNKNRPIPPVEPKKFTDDELRNHGIHMASRLHTTDGQGTANNWADIDDDDQDWAPENLTWTDGTKITIPHVVEDTATHPVPGPTDGRASSATASPATRPAVPSSTESQRDKTPTVAPAPSAPKPGVLGSGRGLLLKGASEKPTLVAKPPAPPAQPKSPWATLPPVDKSSPIAMDLPAPAATTSRFQQKDIVASNTSAASHLSTKEIAADDFSRSSWRDGGASQTRELYNSQSGRYEPVGDRRHLNRTDPNSRQPAVLQRPPHADSRDPSSPAEPSAAFQTARSTGQDQMHGRRRNSSNVSGGSGQIFNRFRNFPHDQQSEEGLGLRKDSFAAGNEETSTAGRPQPYQGPPSQQRTGPWQPPSQHSPNISNATTYSPPTQHPSVSMTEDDVEYQKKLMRQKLDLARKRKQDEEAMEKAARDERIRQKLEALGPGPAPKSARREAGKDDLPTPTSSVQHRDGSVLSSPSLASELPHDPSTAAPTAPQVAPAASAKPDTRTNGSGHSKPPNTPAQPAGAMGRQASQEGRLSHAWGEGAAAQPTAWGAARNVWGSPHNERTLGNGIFNADLQRLNEGPHATPPPGPIGPPRGSRVSSAQSSSVEVSQGQPKPIGPPASQQPQHNASTLDAWRKPGMSIMDQDRLINEDSRRRHQEMDRQLAAKGLTLADVQPPLKDTWKPVTVDGLTRTNQTAHEAEAPASRDSTSKAGLPSWSDLAGSKKDAKAAVGAVTGSAVPATVPAPHSKGSRFFPVRDVRLEEVAPPQPAEDESGRYSPTPPPPTMSDHPAYDGDAARPHVALPPPQPKVRLPPAPAPARAPLPQHHQETSRPAEPAARDADVAARRAPPTLPSNNRSGGTSAGKVGDWQARINDLIGRKSSPTKSPGDFEAMASVMSADSHHHSPRSAVAASSPIDRAPTTKGPSEECFEEQEMGSLPTVRIPAVVSDAAWSPALPPTRPFPRRFVVYPNTVEALSFAPKDIPGTGLVVDILLPHMTKPKHVTVAARSSSYSNPRAGGLPSPRGGSSMGRGGRGPSAGVGNRGSNAPSRHPPAVGGPHLRPGGSGSNDRTPSVPTVSMPGRGGRSGGGGYRRGNDWNRHTSLTHRSPPGSTA